AAALARALPAARVWASDRERDALAVARANLGRHAPGVGCVAADLIAPWRAGAFDLIVSNPPYVSDAELAALAPEVRDHEPRAALDGGPGAAREAAVTGSGSKNAALPLLSSTLRTPRRCLIRNVPVLRDIRTAVAVLRHLGARVAPGPDGHEITVEAGDVARSEAPYELV